MALNKLENVNPLPPLEKKKKNQKCGRDLANFYFGVRCLFVLSRWTLCITWKRWVTSSPPPSLPIFFVWQFLPKPRFWWYKTSHYLLCYGVANTHFPMAWYGWGRTHSPNSRTHRHRLTHALERTNEWAKERTNKNQMTLMFRKMFHGFKAFAATELKGIRHLSD